MEHLDMLVKQVNDLMVDAMKWKKIAHHTEDVERKEEYKRIANMLYECYKVQHEELERMFKND